MTPFDVPDLILDTAGRLALAQTPTPIQRLSRLGDALGARLYCKRDDLTGFGFGGNKVRKLEYLLAEALRAGCDSLVTWGSNQSNWCCIASVAGAVLGLEVHLVLAGPTPERDTGNLILDRLAGAHITHLDTEDDAVLEQAACDLERALRAEGRKPYRMVVGGSTGLGALGYGHALLEVMEYEKAAGVNFSTIIHATGSGGTQAGLIAASVLCGWPGRIIGMAVSRSSAAQAAKVGGLLRQMLSEPAAARARIIVEDGFVGEGYRRKTAACAEALRLFARTEGIFLDEVYTGKAAAGLIAYCREKRIASTENILFLHTGGTAQLFE